MAINSHPRHKTSTSYDGRGRIKYLRLWVSALAASLILPRSHKKLLASDIFGTVLPAALVVHCCRWDVSKSWWGTWGARGNLDVQLWSALAVGRSLPRVSWCTKQKGWGVGRVTPPRNTIKNPRHIRWRIGLLARIVLCTERWSVLRRCERRLFLSTFTPAYAHIVFGRVWYSKGVKRQLQTLWVYIAAIRYPSPSRQKITPSDSDLRFDMRLVWFSKIWLCYLIMGFAWPFV